MDLEPLHTSEDIGEATRTDELVAIAAQHGDANAFGVLVDRYEKKLQRYGRKFLSNPADIEDLVQEAFVNAYRNLQSFDTKQRFSPWIYRIAHNAFINALRKKSHSAFVYLNFDTLLAHPIAQEESDTATVEREMKELVDQGLEKLVPAYREVLILYYLEALSYTEIAEVLRVPTGTVGVRLRRARAALSKIYAAQKKSYEF